MFLDINKNIGRRFTYYPYVIGGDTAGDGSDFLGQVLDNTDGMQVAKLKHQFDEDLYARQMFCLGKYYNYALLVIETNFSTYPCKGTSKARLLQAVYKRSRR